MTHAMAGKSGFEALRGIEDQVLGLSFQTSTSEQWAVLLKGPLERAAHRGNRGLVQKLLEARAHIGTALHEAVRGGHGEVVEDLLESGVSINGEDTADGKTPLHVAAEEGRTEMVQL